jgi:hypothetical protein
VPDEEGKGAKSAKLVQTLGDALLNEKANTTISAKEYSV